MLRMLSSALGDRCKKLSQAAKRMADDVVEPGRNMDTEDAASRMSIFTFEDWHPSKCTRHFLDEVANILPYNAGTIGFCDNECRTEIQITFDVISHYRK